MTDSVFPVALVAAGGWREVVFASIMAVPLLFFLACAVYLWRLLISAIPARARLSILTPIASANEAITLSAPTVEVVQPFGMDAGTRTEPPLDFVILIPAHNEELVLGAALSTLRNLDYPVSAYRIVVIADNCTDRTAAIAREHGAVTLVREDRVSVGKGYALAWALERLQSAEFEIKVDSGRGRPPEAGHAAPVSRSRLFDAVVIIDADTLVAPNLLRAFAQKLRLGNNVLQARYEVLNVHESWRTRLMSCALALAHIVKPMGREQLSLSDGLKGNGMCFDRAVVMEVPWSGASITEDIDYTIRLCRAGYRVAFVPETAVWAQMPTTAAQSASQRKRWEGGRYQLICHVAPRLLVDGIRKRSGILVDRAIELVIPPFAEMFAVPVTLLCACLLAMTVMKWHSGAILSAAWCSVLLLQAGYLFGGMWMARIPLSVALTALYAPGYILWKFGLYGAMVVQRSAGGWMRTERRKLGG